MRSVRLLLAVEFLLAISSLTNVAYAQSALFVQRKPDAVPLKHWPAPLHWQPTRAETEVATGKADVFSALRSDATVAAADPVGSLENAITPAVPNVDTQLRAVVDQPTYQTSLTTAHNLASSFTNGRIVITLSDGTVVIDTGKPDDPMDATPGVQANSFGHFSAKTVNENHNSRLAIFLAQEYPCGIGIETKFSTSTGQTESYVGFASVTTWTPMARSEDLHTNCQ